MPGESSAGEFPHTFRTSMVSDVLKQALHRRPQRSDRDLIAIGTPSIEPTVESVGNSYNNALTEMVIGLFET